MKVPLSNEINRRKKQLSAQLKFKMLAIAFDSTKFWEYPEEFDQFLIQAINKIPQTKLVYAIDIQGKQISSNIFSDGSRRHSARGQDLSNVLMRTIFIVKKPFHYRPCTSVQLIANRALQHRIL